ncbi:hypothetical protein [Schleiferilactobacillus shenzhenensis]|uniref:hypothetical protein n=1 Tax=Schleiferilactobacillus shenzhenensis TaxID=1231337 RepID=UPI0012DEBB18|nr:hypothetical protein [Schleiferilactobacillus shenzhenensis]
MAKRNKTARVRQAMKAAERRLDEVTQRAEADVAAGRVHSYAGFADYQKAMDNL